MAHNHRIDIRPQIEIIENEIDRLLVKSSDVGLDLDDTRKLDVLSKLKELLLGNPTTISQTNRKRDDVSDDELFAQLTKGKPKLTQVK